MALEKNIFGPLGLSVYAQYLSNISFEVDYQELRSSATPTNQKTIVEERSTFIYGADISLTAFSAFNFQLSLFAGAFYGPSISGRIEETLTFPSFLDPVTPPNYAVEYSYSFGGSRMGFRTDYWLLPKTGIWTAFSLLKKEEVIIADQRSTSSPFQFQMGLVREF